MQVIVAVMSTVLSIHCQKCCSGSCVIGLILSNLKRHFIFIIVMVTYQVHTGR